MSLDLPALRRATLAHGAVVRVLVLRTAGSVPRETGVSMLVWADGQEGTIGGGALEWEALLSARVMLRGRESREMRVLPLGPALGQCCGGSVTLLWEQFDSATLPELPFVRPLSDRARATPPPLAGWQPGTPPLEAEGWLVEGAPSPVRPLWIWGAGHVGRAMVEVMAPLPGFAITWADYAMERFPDAPPGVTTLPATDLPRLAAHAPEDAAHLIVTLSHDTDLALCHALLMHGFAYCGLIGSMTKWARFRSRLQQLGHAPAQISRIACPIGDPALGKHPQAIAVGVAVALLKEQWATRQEVSLQGDRTA